MRNRWTLFFRENTRRYNANFMHFPAACKTSIWSFFCIFSFRPDCNALDACVGGYCQAGSLDPLPWSFPQFERRLWRNEVHQVMCLCPRSHQDEAARPLGDESLILLLTWQTLEVWSQWMLTTNNTISRKYAFEAGFLDSCGLFPVFVLLISYTISFCLGSLFCFGYL